MDDLVLSEACGSLYFHKMVRSRTLLILALLPTEPNIFPYPMHADIEKLSHLSPGTLMSISHISASQQTRFLRQMVLMFSCPTFVRFLPLSHSTSQFPPKTCFAFRIYISTFSGHSNGHFVISAPQALLFRAEFLHKMHHTKGHSRPSHWRQNGPA